MTILDNIFIPSRYIFTFVPSKKSNLYITLTFGAGMNNGARPSFTLIEKQIGLDQFCEENKDIEWMCFDTEFVGEKRYHTLLCLIQVATPKGFYLIDTLQVKDLGPFLNLIVNPQVLKITHAGDNEYRLLYNNYQTVPKSVFDTQIAAGFLGYKYPVSFRKLVANELNVYLAKGYTVADWESRPFSKKQLSYALDDVLYLRELFESLSGKLQARNRFPWVEEECSKWEHPQHFQVLPYKDLLKSSLIHSLKPHKQAFLMRLYAWREEEARKKNYSRDMILPNKLIGPIVRNINSGKAALKSSRIIPDRVITKYWDVFNELYQRPMTHEERSFLRELSKDGEESPNRELLMEMLFLLVKHRCITHEVAPTLVMQRATLKKMRSNPVYFDESLATGWRKDLLGNDLIRWLRVRNELEIDVKGNTCTLIMEGI